MPLHYTHFRWLCQSARFAARTTRSRRHAICSLYYFIGLAAPPRQILTRTFAHAHLRRSRRRAHHALFHYYFITSRALSLARASAPSHAQIGCGIEERA